MTKNQLLVVLAVLFLAVAGLGAWLWMGPESVQLASSDGGGAEVIGPDERHTLGNPNAKVTMIEYVALICPTCAFVNNTTIPEFKRRYVDTGKVRYVLRIFPLNPADFKAEGLAMCVPKEKYFDAVDMLYRRQDEWGAEQMGEHGPGFTPDNQPKTDAGLVKMGRALGLDEAKARSCMSDSTVQKVVDDLAAQGGTRYGISGTPTIIINGKVFPQVPRNVEDLAAVIDPLLAAK